ncbi:hypothetical protein HAX54_002229, partial [Datura stramonium]|nr:hypothetical protein [Datura stramonium]
VLNDITKNMENFIEENPNMREENKILDGLFHGNNIFRLTNEGEEEDENLSSYVFDCNDIDDDNNNKAQDTMQTAIYWESQEALLVYICL